MNEEVFDSSRFFLIGFMGSGKSHWGKSWAEGLGFKFIDLDEFIEHTEGLTIDQIFEVKGESFFRQLESEALHRVGSEKNCIIACGGGAPCFHDNMDWMNRHGVTIYLEATPEQVLQRVAEEKDKRPLLKNIDDDDVLLFIEKKISERSKFYKQAKITIPVDQLNTNTVTNLQL